MFEKSERYFLIFCLLSIVLMTFGCNKDKPKESVEKGTGKKDKKEMIKKTLKITNTGSVDINTLRINYNYDANSCIIKDLKSGEMVTREIIVTYPTTMEYVIEYANGETVKNNQGEGFMAKNKELQIVIEDNGKMYFR